MNAFSESVDLYLQWSIGYLVTDIHYVKGILIVSIGSMIKLIKLK